MRFDWLLGLAVCGALAACHHAPLYEQPTVAGGAQFDTDAAGEAAGSQLATEVTWQAFFGDPQLQFLIAEALVHNRDLVASVARIEQARAQYRIQESVGLPRLDVAGGATRSQAVAPPGGTSSGVTLYNVQAAMASYEIDFWGRVSSLNEAARQRYLATVEGDRAFRLSLVANVASAYYAIQAGEEGIDLARRTLGARQYALEIAKMRLDSGVTSSVDHDQAVILVAQAQAQLAELLRSTGQRRSRLLVLVGKPLPAQLPAARPVQDAGQFGALAAGLPSALLVNRPDVVAAEQLLRAAHADIGAARAALLPRIALTGNLGFVSTDLANLLQSGSQIWSVGGLISLPIFDGGLRRAQIDVAQARRADLVARYQRPVQTAFTEVSEALIGRQRFQEQITALEAVVLAQRRLAEVAELRYENGIAIYLEVVDARRNLFSTEQQLIQLRATALQNGVALYAALGGGLTGP